MDAGKTYYALAEVVRACKAKFDEQLSRVHTRAVYQEYKKQYNSNITFLIEPNPDPMVKNGWLVRKIPEKYILKRYTRNAREEVAWDRHDGVRICAQASKEQTRMLKLLPKLMRLGRAESRSDRAFEETDRQLDKITPGIEMFLRSVDGESSDPGASATGSVTTEGVSCVLHNEMLLIEPPVWRTKGRIPGKQKKNGVEPPLAGKPLSTYATQNYGDRECSTCGVRGTHLIEARQLTSTQPKGVPVHKMAP
ncbi:uncharacterized protein C2845_PM13G08790 [Panicum miliaceum]|uniref:Uncharacterized protein n=1 Tax=Panicum miliaceum TaxID=4540 RepID=A0A3L6RM91_PANMI|nr:uncharacterized protein C2845_PM13G08790 [Panicum miliaceum]